MAAAPRFTRPAAGLPPGNPLRRPGDAGAPAGKGVPHPGARGLDNGKSVAEWDERRRHPEAASVSAPAPAKKTFEKPTGEVRPLPLLSRARNQARESRRRETRAGPGARDTRGKGFRRPEAPAAGPAERNGVERRGPCQRREAGSTRSACPEPRLSGKPPSSGGLAKPAARRRTRSLREKTGRKPGGQAGHKGETLRRVAHPDRVEDHIPVCCRGCGASLSGAAAAGAAVARQLFDLPAPRPLEVVEHRVHGRRCGRCGVVTRSGFPLGVSAPAQ